jgi:hypothetical protein
MIGLMLNPQLADAPPVVRFVRHQQRLRHLSLMLPHRFLHSGGKLHSNLICSVRSRGQFWQTLSTRRSLLWTRAVPHICCEGKSAILVTTDLAILVLKKAGQPLKAVFSRMLNGVRMRTAIR